MLICLWRTFLCRCGELANTFCGELTKIVMNRRHHSCGEPTCGELTVWRTHMVPNGDMPRLIVLID